MEEDNRPKGWKSHGFVYNARSNKEFLSEKKVQGIYNVKFEFKAFKEMINPLETLDKLKEQGYERTYPDETKNHQLGPNYMLSYFKGETTITCSMNKETHNHEININFDEPITDLTIIKDHKLNLEGIIGKSLEIKDPILRGLIEEGEN